MMAESRVTTAIRKAEGNVMAFLPQGAPEIGDLTHSQVLEILSRSRPDRLKEIAEQILDDLGDVTVISNRTGLVMLPFVETVRNTTFHLGEVLVAEAHIQVPARSVEGYGAVVGRDLEQSMAMAILDAAIAAGHRHDLILAFLAEEENHAHECDRQTLRKVEATRVQMETF